MNDRVLFLLGSNDGKRWTPIARFRQRADADLPDPSGFPMSANYKYHRYKFERSNKPLLEKKIGDGTWGWR